MKFGIHNPSWVYGADPADPISGARSRSASIGRCRDAGVQLLMN